MSGKSMLSLLEVIEPNWRTHVELVDLRAPRYFLEGYLTFGTETATEHVQAITGLA